jgi:hypothetical protein
MKYQRKYGVDDLVRVYELTFEDERFMTKIEATKKAIKLHEVAISSKKLEIVRRTEELNCLQSAVAALEKSIQNEFK